MAVPSLSSAVPVHAAEQRPVADVSITATTLRGPVGSTAVLRGRVRTRAPETTVLLQRRVGERWTRVGRGMATKRYRFTVTFGHGVARYRVKAKGTNEARSGISPTMLLTGYQEEPPTEAITLEKQQSLVLQHTNEFRAENGLSPLLPMVELNTVAQNWTVKMATTEGFNHNMNFFDEYPQEGLRGGGENIAYGYGTARKVVDAWIASPGHRANMLAAYTHLGVGWYADGTDWWTQNFATYGQAPNRPVF